MALFGQAVSEEMFEYNGDIHVYCHGVGHMSLCGPIFFRIINIQSYCPFPARLSLWFKLYLFELKQISNTYKYIQYKLGSERKPMAYEVHFLKSSKLQKRQLQDDSM